MASTNTNREPEAAVTKSVDSLEWIGNPEALAHETDRQQAEAFEAYRRSALKTKARGMGESQNEPTVSAQELNPKIVGLGRKKLDFITAYQLLREEDQPADYVFGNLAVRGASTGLYAKIKKGKTSLILQGVKAALDGAEFLGITCPPIPAAVYLSEQPRVSSREQVKLAGLGNCPNLHFLYWAETFSTAWPLVAHAVLQKCKDVNAPLLIIDTMHPFFQQKGKSENDAEFAIENMRYVQEITAEGIAVLLAMHERKSSGDLADSGRGSSAYGGAMDIWISMGRPAGNHAATMRELTCVSRFPETPSKMILDFDPQTHLYRPLGSTEAIEKERATKGILSILPTSEGDALTLAGIAKEIDIRRSTCQRAIESLCDSGEVSRIGSGRRGDAFRFFISAQTSPLIDGQKSLGYSSLHEGEL